MKSFLAKRRWTARLGLGIQSILWPRSESNSWPSPDVLKQAPPSRPTHSSKTSSSMIAGKTTFLSNLHDYTSNNFLLLNFHLKSLYSMIEGTNVKFFIEFVFPVLFWSLTFHNHILAIISDSFFMTDYKSWPDRDSKVNSACRTWIPIMLNRFQILGIGWDQPQSNRSLDGGENDPEIWSESNDRHRLFARSNRRPKRRGICVIIFDGG